MKTVILTGATGALGRSVFAKLSESYFVIAQGRNAHIGTKFIEKFSTNCSFVKADFKNETSILNFVDDIKKITNNVYAVVHCIGGGGEHQTYLETDEVKWTSVYYDNVVVPNLINQGLLLEFSSKTIKRFISIGSVAGTHPLSIGVEYASAKAALEISYKSLAKHLQGTGSTANVISPGLIRTDKILKYVTDKYGGGNDIDPEVLANEHIFKSLTGKLSTPEQISGQVTFLLEDDAANITGQNIVVDGGYTLI